MEKGKELKNELIGSDEKVAFGQSVVLLLMLPKMPTGNFFKENF